MGLNREEWTLPILNLVESGRIWSNLVPQGQSNEEILAMLLWTQVSGINQ
jgi:hypothetical protein